MAVGEALAELIGEGLAVDVGTLVVIAVIIFGLTWAFSKVSTKGK